MVSGKLGLSVAIATILGSVVSNANAALYWTSWVSEEGGGPAALCGGAEASVGFGCSGGYCDNVRLLCETLPFSATFDYSSAYFTGFFSEEHDQYSTWTSVGWYRYDNEDYEVCHRTDDYPGIVTGIRCSGSSCDNIQLECTQPVKYVGNIAYPMTVTGCSWSAWQSEEQGSVDFGWNRYITGVQCAGSYCDNKRFLVCSLVDPAAP